MIEENQNGPDVSVILPIFAVHRRLLAIIRAAKQLILSTEVLVICRNSQLSPVAREKIEKAGGRVIPADGDFSEEECRRIGSREAAGNILLFLDDRQLLIPKQLHTYVEAVRRGGDIVMTICRDSSMQTRTSSRTMPQYLLNHVAGREELGSASLYDAPFALSRHAMQTLEFAHSSPPVVQINAFLQKMKVSVVRRQTKPKVQVPIQKFLQDHTSALNTWMNVHGDRGGLWDGGRYRPLLQVPGHLHLRSVYRSSDWESMREGEWDETRKSKKTDTSRKKRRKKTAKSILTRQSGASKRHRRGQSGRKSH
ncbi:DUF4350 domain-containing protein [Brevibacillus panacihumi]|uniref:DUF4350 domain-containing protein n=1 Tax=Brevibacillus panacihumi TaxID=497735 RepID=A0A3M8CC45_9BACL|nr:DUF4350 domain-containing protein [Brevibacillus panacihumi]